MKTAVASVVTATVASACCIGPVAFAALGAGALGAASTRLAPFRPVFLAVTAALLGAAFFVTYRQPTDSCGPDGVCRPASRRAAKVALWLIAALVALIAAFPYYVGWLL
jgi:mercuric ion transport protein